MALIDRARDVYFDRARERWKQKGFDADITDILEDYRAETNKKGQCSIYIFNQSV